MKNLTSNQLLLFALAAVVLLIAALSFILLQDPSAPLPFGPPPLTSTGTPPPASQTPSQTSTKTLIPTRQTSYTPFATTFTPSTPITTTVTPLAGTPSSSPSSTQSTGLTPSRTPTPPTGPTLTPSPSPTLSLGEIAVTGRVLINGTQAANVIVEFVDDVAPRQSTTDQGGHYWFRTLAPGTAFTLTFRQRDNPPLGTLNRITSLAWFTGSLPSSGNPMTFPDFELSTVLNNMIYELQSPMDGAAFSASVISSSNPVQFVWSLYSMGGSYHVELGPNGTNQPIWESDQIASTYYMWNGILDDGTRVVSGTYWWRVAVTKSLGNYVEVIYTQPWDIFFNP